MLASTRRLNKRREIETDAISNHTGGKPYFVYMTAAQNKFLRIYYVRVKECLAATDAKEISED